MTTSLFATPTSAKASSLLKTTFAATLFPAALAAAVICFTAATAQAQTSVINPNYNRCVARASSAPSQVVFSKSDKASAIAEANQRGISEAEQSWTSGDPTIYVYGLRMGKYDFDAETGLPIKQVAGCKVTSAQAEYVRAHNARVRQLIREKGLPTTSRMKTLDKLENPVAVYDNRRARRTQLKLNGAAITSPDGRFNVRWSTESSHLGAKMIVVTDRQSNSVSKSYYFYDGPVYAVWGPEGTDSVLLCDSDRQEGFGRQVSVGALDLASGLWIAAENTTLPPLGNEERHRHLEQQYAQAQAEKAAEREAAQQVVYRPTHRTVGNRTMSTSVAAVATSFR
ncbi:MAG: hypothetical protein RLY93_09545 [Sumerlaeia bacterium]